MQCKLSLITVFFFSLETLPFFHEHIQRSSSTLTLVFTSHIKPTHLCEVMDTGIKSNHEPPDRTHTKTQIRPALTDA